MTLSSPPRRPETTDHTTGRSMGLLGTARGVTAHPAIGPLARRCSVTRLTADMGRGAVGGCSRSYVISARGYSCGICFAAHLQQDCDRALRQARAVSRIAEQG